MKKYKKAIVIGRFSPLHLGHMEMINTAKKYADEVIIFIGSANKPRTIENPWTYNERHQILTVNVLYGSTQCKLHRLNDYIYDDPRWKKQITDVIGNEKSVCMVGGVKGEWYFDLFPEIDKISYEPRLINGCAINATDIRNAYFNKGYEESNEIIKSLVPDSTYSFLKYRRGDKWYEYIKEEFARIKYLRETYGNGPFCTCDNIVVHRDNVLLVKRKNHPGKDLYAIPGGFLEVNESFLEGSYRELQEETKLNISFEEFKKYVKHYKVYDHPKRSIVSRIITYAACIELPSELEVNTEAGDDAADTIWYPISELGKIANKFYDDHADILEENLVLPEKQKNKKRT